MTRSENRMQIMRTVIIMSALLQATACTCNLEKQDTGKDHTFQNGNIIENTFSESDEAFSNPLKGFMTKSALNPYTTLARMDIRWNEIETSKDDGPEKIKEYSDYNFIPFERRGIKIIARVIGCWPQAEYAEAWYSRHTDDGVMSTGLMTSTWAICQSQTILPTNSSQELQH